MPPHPDYFSYWNVDRFLERAAPLLPVLRAQLPLSQIRELLLNEVNRYHFRTYDEDRQLHDLDRVIVRDCAQAWRGLLHPRSESLSGDSVAQRLVRAANGEPPPDASPAFWADIVHLVDGILGRVRLHGADPLSSSRSGRLAARLRSDELDELGVGVDAGTARWSSGLAKQVRTRRISNKRRILSALNSTPKEWDNWTWQLRNVCRNAESLGRLVRLSDKEAHSITTAQAHGYPFAVTPYYASLMDNAPVLGNPDLAVRAQVIPPTGLSMRLASHPDKPVAYDYMRESDTSPIDLITRRYPQVVILKPTNTCPQVCVYCQRNWELDIDDACPIPSSALALSEAIRWLKGHPTIHEVLVTGGDPLMLPDSMLETILNHLASIPHIERIRIGSRVPVTMPMRITPALVRLFARYQKPGTRELCLMTHVQHVYEVTPEFAAAMDRLRRGGIRVYNQHVYTFHVSRRFEAVALRRALRLCGVDPYYTFYPKSKEETEAYRVPLARLLQEQKEESRLLPGLVRTDDAVYNVPGLGKNPLNSRQHRDLISIRPNGARVYEFHPWEKKVAPQRTHIGEDVPVLDYLKRLGAWGEDAWAYESIWYYF